MPDDTDKSTDQNNTENNDNNNQNTTATGARFSEVVLGCDDNGVNDAQVQATVHKAIEAAGYKVKDLGINPDDFANYSYSSDAKGKAGVYLMAASLISYLDAADAGFDFNVLGIRGDVTGWTNEEWKQKPVPQDHDGNYSHPRYDECAGKTYPELNQLYQGRCIAVPGENAEDLAKNIVEALGGAYTGGQVVNSGGGAQIKDKTFEKCIRRICAATDSIFLVESNAAVLFPYTDWMALTLRQKINTIKKDEIDPDVFSMEYGNEGFYNKVTIAWGGGTLPERFPSKTDSKKQVAKDKRVHDNYTMQDILDNMRLTHFIYDKDKAQEKSTPSTDTTKKDKTTQTVSVDENGVTMLSEQYDALVKKYGEMEKRVESAAPDFETAQYIVNALLIQYVRDFNNTCKCRALNVRKYIGGTFYSVENPFDNTSELFYLNSYTIRTKKNDPLYHDLEFKYGPEGAEEILDYQTLSGGAAGGNTINAGSATEEQIWQRATKACHQTTCNELYESESDTEDPQVAENYFNQKEKAGKKFCLTCYGMSAWLYFQFNYKAHIPCQVVGNSEHHVIMLDRGKGMQDTIQEYRAHLETGYRWRNNDQCTDVLLPAPNGTSATSGGNTNKSNTNGGNRGNK